MGGEVMGGRGSGSGSRKSVGFSFTGADGKTYQVIKVNSGSLINGAHSQRDYSKLRSMAEKNSSFKNITRGEYQRQKAEKAQFSKEMTSQYAPRGAGSHRKWRADNRHLGALFS